MNYNLYKLDCDDVNVRLDRKEVTTYVEQRQKKI